MPGADILGTATRSSDMSARTRGITRDSPFTLLNQDHACILATKSAMASGESGEAKTNRQSPSAYLIQAAFELQAVMLTFLKPR